MPLRKHSLRPDKRGDFRPYVGTRNDGNQQRFNLGKDARLADLMYERIRTLYRESEAVRLSYGLPPTWTAAALHAAKHIQLGLDHIPLPSAHVVNEAIGEGRKIGAYECEWDIDEPQAILWSHSVASRHYPSVKWILPHSAAGTVAIKLSHEAFDNQASKQAQILSLPSKPSAIQGTLHQALDKYEKFVEEQAARNLATSTVLQRKSQIKYLKQAHQDRPLAILDLNECRGLFEHWTTIPKKSESKSFARHTCKHRVSELSMFLDWLHTSNQFAWRKPEDFDTISKKIKKLPGQRKSIREIIAKKTFQVEHLATIYKHCDPLDRLMLTLGLNCCFGAAESGRLEIDDVFVHQPNPIGHVWKHFNFVSSEEDSWIGYLRPKTQVAGMWWLWPETVKALEEWLQVRPESSSPRVIVTATGSSLYRDNSKNGQSGFQARWKTLLQRARATDKTIPELPFGALRDHFSDWLVYTHKSESASIALAHGKPFKDDLLTCYANLPFPAMFEQQKAYRNVMQKIFETKNS